MFHGQGGKFVWVSTTPIAANQSKPIAGKAFGPGNGPCYGVQDACVKHYNDLVLQVRASFHCLCSFRIRCHGLIDCCRCCHGLCPGNMITQAIGSEANVVVADVYSAVLRVCGAEFRTCSLQHEHDVHPRSVCPQPHTPTRLYLCARARTHTCATSSSKSCMKPENSTLGFSLVAARGNSF